MITQYLKWDQVLDVTVFMSIGLGEHLQDNGFFDIFIQSIVSFDVKMKWLKNTHNYALSIFLIILVPYLC
ncbi:MAG TPA: hypothetical protein DEV85_11985 [Vibrio sp.]|nr:hypothetical protein [Vibrio sp.]